MEFNPAMFDTRPRRRRDSTTVEELIRTSNIILENVSTEAKRKASNFTYDTSLSAEPVKSIPQNQFNAFSSPVEEEDNFELPPLNDPTSSESAPAAGVVESDEAKFESRVLS